VSDQNKPETVTQLLERAAALAVERDLDLDAFMRGAWSAYVDARPGFREQLEEKALRSQIDALRQAGQIAQA
jgi:hypothetical protein